jgi:hypothetical protein
MTYYEALDRLPCEVFDIAACRAIVNGTATEIKKRTANLDLLRKVR